MKKLLKIPLIVLGSILLVAGSTLGISTIVNTSKTSVSEKAKDIKFTDFSSVNEIKNYFGNPSWSDEFNDYSLDMHNWTYSGHNLHRNNELQYYTDDENNGSLSLKDGSLIIRGDKLTEAKYGYNYSSVSLVTQNKKLFRYGYYEMRALLPEGNGLWPAFWLMGQVDYIPPIKNQAFWPLCGEIDIMESIGGKENNNTSHGDIHWVNGLKEYFNWRKSGFKDSSRYRLNNFIETKNFILDEGTFKDNYHTFGLGWSEKEIVWYIDGVAYMNVDITSEQFDCFRSKGWYILINLAIGGNWPGNPDETTPWPAEYKIDYIRVYQ